MSTVFDKIWMAHVITTHNKRDLLYIDQHFIHEVTSPQAFSGLRVAKRSIRRPEKTFATMDHNIPTTRIERENFTDMQSKLQVDTLRKNCEEFGIELADIDTKNNGIVHIIGPEQGRSLPGKTIVCGDSHTATHGAFAAIAFGIGTSEVEHVFATQTLWQTKPKNLGIEICGILPKGVTAKDVILGIIAKYGVSYGTGFAIEFFGEAIDKMTMEERMTLTNMSIEFGAKYGIIAFDQVTHNYLLETTSSTYALENLDFHKTLLTDARDDFDEIITFDISHIAPQITWGTSPEQCVGIDCTLPHPRNIDEEKAYEYTRLQAGIDAQDIPVDYVFIGSCTNGRITDLIEGAKYIKGRRVASNVTAFIVPGSEKVARDAKLLGIDKEYIEAGFEWRLPGCSACLGMNTDQIPSGKHCISTSNRNFVGRQGSGAITHLASVPTAVLSALNGKVMDSRREFYDNKI